MPEAVVEYFEESGFRDDFRLLLVLTDGDFSPLGIAFDVDFSGDRPVVTTISAADAETRFRNYEPVAEGSMAHQADQGASGKPGLRDQQYDALGRSLDRFQVPHRSKARCL